MSDETKTQIQSSQLQGQQTFHDSSNQISFTLRLLMLGKEVGGIIGKKGDNIKRFREESGAKINISDGSCPERIVTLSGSVHEVFKAFTMICRKFEEGLLFSSNNYPGNQSPTSSRNIDSGSLLLSNSGVSTNNSLCSDAMSSIFTGLSPNSAGLINSALTDGSLASCTAKDADMLTLNNNNTSTLNNNNNTNNNTNNSNNDNHDNNGSNNNDLTAALKTELNTLGSNNNNNSGSNTPLITLKLIIPASQCGSLIGRGGAKIKEIREMTGAAIQVATDVLPNSTERVVTLIGNVEALTRCAYQICNIMVECPPKGYTIQYRPKPAMNPMLFAAANAGQSAATVYNLPPQYALSAHPDVNRLFVTASNPLAAAFNTAVNLRAAAAPGANNQSSTTLSALGSQAMSNSHEMVIPNGLIGCVIGKGGSKINEIRQLSGATIKISDSEAGAKNRTVTITGTPEAINIAQYLITASYTGGHTTLIDNCSKASVVNKTRKFAPY